MSEKRFTIKPQDDYWAVVDNYNEDKVCIINGIHTEIEAIWLCDFMNEQQATIEHLTKSRDKWSKSAKLHSEYFDCLEKAIEIAYEEKPYPKIEDIMTIYSKLEKEIDDE